MRNISLLIAAFLFPLQVFASVDRFIPLALPRGTPEDVVERGKRICSKEEGTKAATCMKSYAQSYMRQLTKKPKETQEQRRSRELGLILCERHFLGEKQKACIEYYEEKFFKTGRSTLPTQEERAALPEEELTELQRRSLERQLVRLQETSPATSGAGFTPSEVEEPLPIDMPEEQIWGQERKDWRRRLNQAGTIPPNPMRSPEWFGSLSIERKASLKYQLKALEQATLRQESLTPLERKRMERIRRLEIERQKIEERRLVPLQGLEIYNPEGE